MYRFSGPAHAKAWFRRLKLASGVSETINLNMSLEKRRIDEQCLVSEFWGKKSWWALAQPKVFALAVHFLFTSIANLCSFATLCRLAVEIQHRHRVFTACRYGEALVSRFQKKINKKFTRTLCHEK